MASINGLAGASGTGAVSRGVRFFKFARPIIAAAAKGFEQEGCGGGTVAGTLDLSLTPPLRAATKGLACCLAGAGSSRAAVDLSASGVSDAVLDFNLAPPAIAAIKGFPEGRDDVASEELDADLSLTPP